MKLKYISAIILILSLIGISQVFAAEETEVDFSQVQNTEEIETPAPKEIKPTAFYPLELGDKETIYKQISRRYDVVDPAITASYYPGGRGPNKLVIYTKNFGYHTGTNEFGTEAIVNGNIVTSLSGADSAIPEDGIVISGHGSAKNWISQNITEGSKVYIDTFTQTLTVFTTSESYTYEAKNKIDEALSIVNYYKNTMPYYNSNKAENHIRTANNYLKLAQNAQGNATALKLYSSEAIDAANNAIKSSLPYIPDELKGIWLRPTEKNAQQIISTLDNLKDNGFNNVYLETYYHGKTIFPSDTMNKYGFTVQNENFEGFNPLEIWISEAHKRGIKVHIWFQSFYVGNQPPSYNSNSILSVHPDWGNKTKQFADQTGATKSVSEHNGYFLDPANPEVQDFLEELITEIITKYKPDGINLDYIRYPNSNPRNDMNAWGFSEYARKEFAALYGQDPVELNISDVLWYDWNNYRRNKITQFVKRIGKLGKDSDTYISAVIFPDIASAISSKQQDWRTWSFNDYINGFTPLFLTYDSKMLASMMNDVLRVKSPSTDLYAGLFVTFMGGPSEDLIRQIFEARKMNANGIILFDYAHTTAAYTSTLMAGAFNSSLNKNIKVAQKLKKKVVQEEKQKREDKYFKKTVITTNRRGNWVYSK